MTDSDGPDVRGDVRGAAAKAGADPQIDPKALIHDAYRMEGISGEECRSIFLDWALSLPMETNQGEALRRLLNRHAATQPNHPMSAILTEGLGAARTPKRRGGWRGRAR